MTAAATADSRAPIRPSRATAAAIASVGIAAACLAHLGPSAFAVVQAAAVGLLVWLAAIDLEFRLVPNRIVLPATAAVLVVTAAFDAGLAVERLAAAVGVGAFLLVAALLRPGALGFGDVKLGLLLGATLGGSVLTALLVGFGAVAVVGLLLVARSGRRAFEDQLPLVPFLAFGALVAIIAGSP